MQKKQNTRRSLTKSIHKIYGAGMFVIAGFIVGFDTEKGSIADGMVDCIEDADIAICMAGLLTALANTQLTARLTRENRMFPVTWQMEKFNEGGGDQCSLGLNFDTLRPRRDVLADYKSVIDRIYTPQAYFGRVTRVARELNCFWPPKKPAARPAWRFAVLAAADWAALFRLLGRSSSSSRCSSATISGRFMPVRVKIRARFSGGNNGRLLPSPGTVLARRIAGHGEANRGNRQWQLAIPRGFNRSGDDRGGVSQAVQGRGTREPRRALSARLVPATSGSAQSRIAATEFLSLLRCTRERQATAQRETLQLSLALDR